MKLKVLLYVNCDGAQAGGVQSMVRALRHYLEARGHDVSIGWAQGGEFGRASGDGWIRQFPVRPGKARWFHLPSAASLAWKLLRERPKVVHLHYASPSALYFTRFARWLPFRVMLTCHGSDILRPLPGDRPYLPQVLKTADIVTAVTTDMAEHLRESGLPGSGEIRIIPNGVATDFWRPQPEAGCPKGEPLLLAVGRLEPVKGLDLLIGACALLAAAGRPLRLVIIGEGSQRDALAQQARATGIADRVTFAGQLAPSEIRAHLRAADLFVLPSRSEGMPLALLEAMATGVACVAADVGGVPKTAAGAARLIPPEDPQALAAAIADLLDQPQERRELGKKARARALDHSVELAHAAYEAAMLELVGAAPA
jgi:glycosyltransferase involved in cell wall biosynthesis